MQQWGDRPKQDLPDLPCIPGSQTGPGPDMRERPHLPRLLLVGLALVAVVQVVVLVARADDDEPPSVVRLEEGDHFDFAGTSGTVRYHGFGEVTLLTDESCPVLGLRPQAPAADDVTHAGLAVVGGEQAALDVTVEMRTTEQLRPVPNTWEAAWLLWSFAGDQRFYYVTLKPNGWEIGKADPEYPGAQRFLATGEAPTLRLGTWTRIRVVHEGDRMEVEIDGDPVATVVDEERPYVSGAVAFYTEDAAVEFRPAGC